MADNEGLSLVDLVSGFRTQFKDTIKPFISKQEYLGAKLEMIQMCVHLSEHYEEIKRYHSGDNCLASAIVLRDLLQKGSTHLDLAIRYVEAGLAQLYLAIKSNNKFY